MAQRIKNLPAMWETWVSSLDAPQDEAGLTRKFETSHVGGATCRTTPISWSALEMNPSGGGGGLMKEGVNEPRMF